LADRIPDIGILCDDHVPDDDVDALASALAVGGLDIQIRRRRSGPYAGLEWLAVTSLVVYIFRPYLDAFLGEAGKDHYQLLKSALSSVSKAVMGKGRIIEAGGVSRSSRFSTELSLIAEDDDGQRFKLLFRNLASPEDIEAAVGAFLTFLERYFTEEIDENMKRECERVRCSGGTVLVTYEPDRQRLVVVDPLPRHIRDRVDSAR
jgi:hypothetical protein